MWFAGIDWADTHHDAVVIDAAGQRVGAIRVAHNAAGLAKLVVFLRGIGDGDSVTDPDRLACIVDTSHGLLITALLEAGLPVYSTPSTRRPSSGIARPPAPRRTPSTPTCARAPGAATARTCAA